MVSVPLELSVENPVSNRTEPPVKTTASPPVIYCLPPILPAEPASS